MQVHFSWFILNSILWFPAVSSAWTTADSRPLNYNSLRRPQATDDEPVTINVNIDLVSLLAVNEYEQVRLILVLIP